MTGPPSTRSFLEAEARALLTRAARLKPFVVQETMLPAAVLLPDALVGTERLLLRERAKLRGLGRAYLRWLAGPGAEAPAEEQQRRFTVLRMRFNDHLSQLDLFSDAISQRSESEVGVWLSGLDLAASDALRIAGGRLDHAVPVLCYLDRGPGAAIRRARTRLPGDAMNPVALIRVPRERMVGHTIASSLFHEVGHQGAALLDLVPSLRTELDARAKAAGTDDERFAWTCWSTWISEIVADFWSVAKLGIGSTLGLIGVVGLPRPFVFRFTLTDPHPFPWIRVIVSSAIGDQVYPDPQWRAIRQIWTSMYPVASAPPAVAQAIGRLAPTIPALAAVLAGHRPAALEGANLGDVLTHPSRQADHLRQLHGRWETDRLHADQAPPALRLAVLGQARFDGRIDPVDESRQVDRMLGDWAKRSTLAMAAAAAATRTGAVGADDRPPIRAVPGPVPATA